MQESLLARTDAIKKQTVEIEPHGRKWLVRYKDSKGSVTQAKFQTPEEATKHFWKCVDKMKIQIQGGKRNGTRNAR